MEGSERKDLSGSYIQDTLSSRAALGLPLGRVRRASKGILHTRTEGFRVNVSEWRDPCGWIQADGSELRYPSGGIQTEKSE